LHNISVSYRIANSALRRFQRPPPARASAANLPSGPRQKSGLRRPLAEASCPSVELPGGGDDRAACQPPQDKQATRNGHSYPHRQPSDCWIRSAPKGLARAYELSPSQDRRARSMPRIPGRTNQVCQNLPDEFWHSFWRDGGCHIAAAGVPASGDSGTAGATAGAPPAGSSAAARPQPARRVRAPPHRTFCFRGWPATSADRASSGGSFPGTPHFPDQGLADSPEPRLLQKATQDNRSCRM